MMKYLDSRCHLVLDDTRKTPGMVGKMRQGELDLLDQMNLGPMKAFQEVTARYQQQQRGLLEPEPPPWQVFTQQSRVKDGAMFP